MFRTIKLMNIGLEGRGQQINPLPRRFKSWGYEFVSYRLSDIYNTCLESSRHWTRQW